jgi:hypothetical protein
MTCKFPASLSDSRAISCIRQKWRLGVRDIAHGSVTFACINWLVESGFVTGPFSAPVLGASLLRLVSSAVKAALFAISGLLPRIYQLLSRGCILGAGIANLSLLRAPLNFYAFAFEQLPAARNAQILFRSSANTLGSDSPTSGTFATPQMPAPFVACGKYGTRLLPFSLTQLLESLDCSPLDRFSCPSPEAACRSKSPSAFSSGNSGRSSVAESSPTSTYSLSVFLA